MSAQTLSGRFLLILQEKGRQFVEIVPKLFAQTVFFNTDSSAVAFKYGRVLWGEFSQWGASSYGGDGLPVENEGKGQGGGAGGGWGGDRRRNRQVNAHAFVKIAL